MCSCHIISKYRGSAHQICNSVYRLTQKTPFIFYNLKGYDSNYITQETGKLDHKNNCYIKSNGKNLELSFY